MKLEEEQKDQVKKDDTKKKKTIKMSVVQFFDLKNLITFY